MEDASLDKLQEAVPDRRQHEQLNSIPGPVFPSQDGSPANLNGRGNTVWARAPPPTLDLFLPNGRKPGAGAGDQQIGRVRTV